MTLAQLFLLLESCTMTVGEYCRLELSSGFELLPAVASNVAHHCHNRSTRRNRSVGCSLVRRLLPLLQAITLVGYWTYDNSGIVKLGSGILATSRR